MKSKYFKLYELVDKDTYARYGEKAWKFLDSRAIEMLDKLKEHFASGTITINNYHWKGDRQWSGLRTPKSMYFSQYSQHTFGRAFDCVFSDYDVNDVRDFIIANSAEFPHIKGIELDVGWLHFDVRNEDEVIKFKS